MSGLAHQLNSQLTPRAPVARRRRGFGDTPSIPQTQIFTQQGQSGKDYAMNTVSAQTGISQSQISQIADQFTSGDPAKVMIAVDATIISIFGSPQAGAAFEELVGWLYAFGASQNPPPCTVPGCESVLPNTRPCSSNDYRIETLLTNNYMTGSVLTYTSFPGTFQDMATRAIMAGWDLQVTAPKACQVLASGVDLMTWANAYVGTMIVPLVAAWNKAHPNPSPGAPAATYKISAPANFSGLDPISLAIASLARAAGLPSDANASIEVSAWSPSGVFPPGSTFPADPHPCPPDSYWNGSACVLPSINPGATLKPIPIERLNNIRLTPPPSSNSGTTLLGTTAAVAAAVALGTYLYARHKHVPVKTVLKSAWKKTGGKIHVPHHLPKLLGRHSR